jgi:putative spermidine/putrescine transport system permease protein
MNFRRILSRLGTAVATVVIAGFALGPLVAVLGASVTRTAYWRFPPDGITLRWYDAFVHNRDLVQATVVSLEAATVVAGAATSIALMVALILARSRLSRSVRDTLTVLVLVPLLIPGVALGVAIYAFYLAHSVPINFVTLGLAQVILALPLITGLLLVALESVRPNVERAAANLGAGPWHTLTRVTVPLLRSALVAAAVLAFIRSFDDAAVALFVNAPPSTITLAVQMLIAQQNESGPLIAASGSVLLAMAAILVGAIQVTIGLPAALGLNEPAR